MKVKKASLFSERLQLLVTGSVTRTNFHWENTPACKSEKIKITGIIQPFSIVLGYLTQL